MGGDDFKNRSGEDRISQLPDHILDFILSSLPIREISIMCSMSQRWIRLWSNLVAFDFDVPKARFQVNLDTSLLQEKRCWFINCVNQILNAQEKNSTNIDTFRIRFDLDNASTSVIDAWLGFVTSKKVEKLELDLTSFTDQLPHASSCYTLSQHLHRHLPGLKSLTLRYVNVTGEILEQFLSNSGTLERLQVDGSETLDSLRIVGSNTKLQHLEILDCSRFEGVEICAPTLLSFGYYGKKMRLSITYAPLLAHVHLHSNNPSFGFPPLSTYFSQLETLHLGFHMKIMSELTGFPEVSAEFTSLKHMKITVNARSYDSPIGLDSLLKSAPRLHKLTLRLITWKSRFPEKQSARAKSPYKFQSLKMVEVIGFRGYRFDFEIAMLILESCSKLEKFIIDRRNPHLIGTHFEFREYKDTQAAMKRALQLKQMKNKVSPSVDLVIAW